MKTFTTPKGTVLPIMDIKGRDYLQAAPRIVWFREEKPEWGIETEFLSLSDSQAVCRATIRNEQGRIIAQATSMETKQGFESFVEKAETCAVSRAASFCNFGTLMAQELEEQGRLQEGDIDTGRMKLAEAPPQPKGNAPIQMDGGDYVLRFGKFVGRSLDSVGAAELRGYYEYLKKQQKAGDKDSEGMQKIAAYVASRVPKEVK